MSTTWIRDKVVAVAEAQAEETGEDANEIIWQLSKELGTMVQVGTQPVVANINISSADDADLSDSVERIKKALSWMRASNPEIPTLEPVVSPEYLQTLSDYALAELHVLLRVERQRRIDKRNGPQES